jgi:hypothetical protein
METFYKILGVEKKFKFPFQLPQTLRHRHLAYLHGVSIPYVTYVVSYKADGEHFFMYWKDDHCIEFIDRLMRVSHVWSLPPSDTSMAGTILEIEYMKDRNQIEVFDCIAWRGVLLDDYIYINRLQLMHRWLWNAAKSTTIHYLLPTSRTDPSLHRSLFPHSHMFTFRDSQTSFAMKPVFEIHHVPFLLKHMDDFPVFPTDGLVFTAADHGLFWRANQQSLKNLPLLLKWKPKHTIDFQIRMIDSRGTIYFQDWSSNTINQSMFPQPVYAGQVWEIDVSQPRAWKVMKLRPDKTKGNPPWIIEDILGAVRENVKLM